MNSKAFKSSGFTYLWGLFLTLTTFIFGGAAFSKIYRQLGQGIYWLSFMGISCFLFGLGYKGLALTLVSMTFLMGIFSLLNEKKVDTFVAGMVSVLITGFAWMVGAYYWFASKGEVWHQVLNERSKEVLKVLVPQGAANLSEEQLTSVVSQLPSGAMIVLAFAVFSAVIFDKEVLKNRKKTLLEFRLPDGFIWVFIAALLAAFVKTDTSQVNNLGLNVLNFVTVLYFFQGLSILVFFMEEMKTAPLWRTILYVLVFTQLFLMMAVFGLIDYWADFRSRFKRRKAGINRQQRIPKNL